MVIPVPSLSAGGWIKSPAEKADTLIAHFFESDSSQSLIYAGHISNLQFVIEQYGHDMVQIVSQLRFTLESYLSRYYDSINVDVTSDAVSTTNVTNDVTLTIYCDVTQDGTTYSFGKLLQVKNSKLQKVMNLNNTGTA